VKAAIRIIIILALLALIVAGIFYYIESDKEIYPVEAGLRIN
jgi:lipopolysaccharide export system protein LptC